MASEDQAPPGDEEMLENDDDIQPGPSMSESYSKIMSSPTKGPQGMTIPPRRPDTLNAKSSTSFPYGLVSVGDDNMTHFVADDLENKIKLASPVPKNELDAETPTPRLPTESASAMLQKQFLSSVPQIDSNVLNDIEIEAQYLAATVDNLTENLYNLLHSISSIAADNVEAYKSAVSKLTDCMDSNIKTMYTIMAKAEEISNSLKPTEELAVRIRDIRRFVDMLDNVM